MTTLPRTCLGCGTKIRAGSRCPACKGIQERARDARRGSRQARGYNAEHEAERKRWAPVVDAGQVSCARCGLPVEPGAAWDLDHLPDRSGWLGPAHQRCNRAAASNGGRIGWGT